MTTIRDLYDLLHHLVDKADWFSEQDLFDAHAAVNAANPNGPTRDLPQPGASVPTTPSPADQAALVAAQVAGQFQGDPAPASADPATPAG